MTGDLPVATATGGLWLRVHGLAGQPSPALLRLLLRGGVVRHTPLDKSGEARVADLPAGPTWVEGEFEGPRWVREVATVTAGMESEVWIHPHAEGTTVAGRVLTERTQAPIAGAIVTVVDSSESVFTGQAGPRSEATDALGRFRTWRPLLAHESDVATQRLWVKAPGHAAVLVDMPEPVLGGEAPEVIVLLRPGGMARGRVLTPDGAPQAGACVVFVPQGDEERRLDPWAKRWVSGAGLACGLTDGEGRYELSGLAFDAVYVATARADGYLRAREVGDLSLNPTQPCVEAELVLRRLSSLALTVVGPLERRLGHARAWVTGAAHWAAPGEDGRIWFDQLEAGPGVIHVHADGFLDAHAEVLLVANSLVEHSIRLERPAMIVEGILADETGAPVAGVSVRGNPAGWLMRVEADTGHDGSFRLEGLPAGPVTLYAYGEALSWHQPRFEVTAPAHSVRLVVERAARLLVRLHVPEGVAAPRAIQVLASYPDGMASDMGSIEPEGDDFPVALRAGSPKVEVRAAGMVSRTRVLGLNPGQDTRETFVLEVGRVFQGRVVTPEGVPVPRARVELERRQPPYEMQADGEGLFRLEGLSDGPLHLRLWAEGYARTRVAVTPIPPGPPEDLVLARGVWLRGRIVDARGRGLAAEPVWIDRDDDIERSGGEKVASDDAGRFALRLEPGPWTCFLCRELHEGIPVLVPVAQLTILEGQDRELELRAQR